VSDTSALFKFVALLLLIFGPMTWQCICFFYIINTQ
jgi:hypothetical protein